MEKTLWQEFADTGLLWLVNTILMVFGYSICIEYNEDGNEVVAYPIKTKFRGFSEKTNTEKYKILTKYMKNNVDRLLKDIEE